jgi:hypothetical protein
MATAKRRLREPRDRLVIYHRRPTGDAPSLRELLDWYAGAGSTNRSAAAGLLLYPELLKAWRRAGSPR